MYINPKTLRTLRKMKTDLQRLNTNQPFDHKDDDFVDGISDNQPITQRNVQNAAQQSRSSRQAHSPRTNRLP